MYAFFDKHILENVLLGQSIFDVVFSKSRDWKNYSDLSDFLKECFSEEPTEK